MAASTSQSIGKDFPSAAKCSLKEQEPDRRCKTCEHRKVIRGRRGNRFLCRFTGSWLSKEG